MNVLFWVGVIVGLLICLALVLMAPAIVAGAIPWSEK
jgi:hypothetical protein